MAAASIKRFYGRNVTRNRIALIVFVCSRQQESGEQQVLMLNMQARLQQFQEANIKQEKVSYLPEILGSSDLPRTLGHYIDFSK